MKLHLAPDERLIPEEGWHVLHLFYQIDHSNWSLLSDSEQLAAKTQFTEVAQDIRSHPDTQLVTCSVVSPKADIACLILTPDLHDLNIFEKSLTLSLGPDLLTPVYSYLSLSVRDQYFAAQEPSDDDVKEFLYPTMPDWPVCCFYNFSMRRNPGENWYSLPAEDRSTILQAHAAENREFDGQVRQFTTSSIGLDDAEWHVTAFAQDTSAIRSLIHRLRFEDLSARFIDFGEFHIGIQLPLDELFRRVGI